MTKSVHNDDKGWKRGEGGYSKSGPKLLATKTYVLQTGKGPGKDEMGLVVKNGNRNSGFAAKIDKV